jgi:hypothetical protein
LPEVGVDRLRTNTYDLDATFQCVTKERKGRDGKGRDGLGWGRDVSLEGRLEVGRIIGLRGRMGGGRGGVIGMRDVRR